MRINELLNESQQIELSEGPKFDKFGRAVGNVAGMAAKGAGAVAGGIAGLGAAAKKGFAAGKQTVAKGDTADAPTDATAADQSGTDQQATPADAAQPADGGSSSTTKTTTTTKPAAKPAGGNSTTIAPPGAGMVQSIKNAWNKYQPKKASTTQTTTQTDTDAEAPTTASDINKAGPKGTAAAKQQTGAAGMALDKTAAATQNKSADQAGQTVYAQVKSQINNLDKKGKQRILQLLQKSLQQAPAKPAAEPAAPAPTQQAAPAPEAPAPTQAAPAAPAAETPPAAEPTKPAPKKRAPSKKKAAASQAEIDADRERIMGNFSDSVERHKQRMVAESIANGTFSIFKK